MTALAKTASTSSVTVAPRPRGVGRRDGFADETASCKKSSPSRGSRPVTISATMSASEKTSVQGPVEPWVLVNCSGAPYAGVKLVTCPLVLVNNPAIFWASLTTFAMPKSSSFTLFAARIADDEDVARLDVAVRDALAVREGERLRHGVKKRHGFRHRPARHTPLRFVPDDALERGALEPLEHHVRHALPACGLHHPDVARLHDRGGTRRQIGQKGALLDELVEELLPVLLGKVGERLEHLERDGPLPDEMGRAVDRREPSLAHERFDGVFVGNRAPDELQGIGFRHGKRPSAKHTRLRGPEVYARRGARVPSDCHRLDRVGRDGLAPRSHTPAGKPQRRRDGLGTGVRADG